VQFTQNRIFSQNPEKIVFMSWPFPVFAFSGHISIVIPLTLSITDSMTGTFKNLRLSIQMLFVPLVASLCTQELTTTGELTFNSLQLAAGETICFPNLPPYTSLVFRHLPPSTVTGTVGDVVLKGTETTQGFDTGNSIATVSLTATAAGKVSYFAVTFPSDCAERIVSNHRHDFIHREKTKTKICYFNGGTRHQLYGFDFKGKASGVLASTLLNGTVTGSTKQFVEDASPAIISWSGQVSEVAIDVKEHHSPRARVTLTGTRPSLIEANEDDSGRGHHDDDHKGDDRDDDHKGGHGDDDDDKRGRHGGDHDEGHHGKVGLIAGSAVGLIVIVGISACGYKFYRRRQERRQAEQARAAVEADADEEARPIQYVYPPPGQYHQVSGQPPVHGAGYYFAAPPGYFMPGPAYYPPYPPPGQPQAS
jgi:hypothetical protein